MRHHNTLLHDLLKFIPWNEFDRLVDKHGSDARVRTLSTKSQFVALLHAQLAGLTSLRDIVAAMHSHSSKLYHVGAKAPRRSTLADANANRPADMFADLLHTLVGQLHRGSRKAVGDALLLIDSTCVPLHALSQNWATDKKRAGACAKLHVGLDACSGAPVHFDITPVRTNDITVAKTIVLLPGATHVFDMGYYDFGWWRQLHEAQCRFVTRLKTHTKPAIIEERAVATHDVDETEIIHDHEIALSHRLKGNRKNPLDGVRLREVKVRISSGKKLRIVTNDMDASAAEIAALYKTRWQIELFFKWVKQNLKIKRFLGTSENAVRIQLIVALIAYVLLKLAHRVQTQITRLSRFTSLVAQNLMHYRSIKQLARPPSNIPLNPNQNELELC